MLPKIRSGKARADDPRQQFGRVRDGSLDFDGAQGVGASLAYKVKPYGQTTEVGRSFQGGSVRFV